MYLLPIPFPSSLSITFSFIVCKKKKASLSIYLSSKHPSNNHPLWRIKHFSPHSIWQLSFCFWCMKRVCISRVKWFPVELRLSELHLLCITWLLFSDIEGCFCQQFISKDDRYMCVRAFIRNNPYHKRMCHTWCLLGGWWMKILMLDVNGT